MKYIFFILTLGAVLLCCEKNTTKPAETPQGYDPVEATTPMGDPATAQLKILIIGNSVTYYNEQPYLFWRLTGAAGKNIYVEQATIPAAQLAYHLNSDYTKNKITAQKWDVVILQEAVFDIALASSRTYATANVLALKNRILANNNATRIFYALPYATREGITWQGTFYDYETSQTMLLDGCRALVQEAGIMTAPVGWAWHESMKNRADLNLYHQDKSHPSLLGSYLAACVYYAAIFQQSVENNSYTVQLNPDVALFLQTTAGQTVLDRLEYWNINAASPHCKKALRRFQTFARFVNRSILP